MARDDYDELDRRLEDKGRRHRAEHLKKTEPYLSELPLAELAERLGPGTPTSADLLHDYEAEDRRSMEEGAAKLTSAREEDNAKRGTPFTTTVQGYGNLTQRYAPFDVEASLPGADKITTLGPIRMEIEDFENYTPPIEDEVMPLSDEMYNAIFRQEAPLSELSDKSNPKTSIGNTKPSLTAIPGTALIHLALGMQNGVTKYGKYNWRENDVPACTYVDAAMRHLLAYADGEEFAKDSGVHHLGHAMSCCAILIDAIEGNHLIDDRGTPGQTAAVIEDAHRILPEMLKKWEDAKRANQR